jgi:hypothetical protein
VASVDPLYQRYFGHCPFSEVPIFCTWHFGKFFCLRVVVCHYTDRFLGAFATLRKATISFSIFAAFPVCVQNVFEEATFMLFRRALNWNIFTYKAFQLHTFRRNLKLPIVRPEIKRIRWTSLSGKTTHAVFI